MAQTADAVIIGGGIAGVSAGFFLTEASQKVILLEAENTLAYHTTGRSAALFFHNYGTVANRYLTQTSQGFFDNPPPELVDGPLLTSRGAMYVALPEQVELLQAEAESGYGWQWLQPSEIVAFSPVLQAGVFAAGLWDARPTDIDVAGLHQAFVRGMRRAGGEIRLKSPVASLERKGGEWEVKTAEETFYCPVVVNAAGAWCDQVAALAGVAPVGLVPKRRTAFMVPGRPEWAHLPLTADIELNWYFKPDGEQVLCSLGEEKPSHPCDAKPEEVDVALAIERINAVSKLEIRTVRSAWTGLRSFVDDHDMVVGFDQQAEGFFWLAGQGGTGIQTAPGAGRLAASLITEGAPPVNLVEALSPRRLHA